MILDSLKDKVVLITGGTQGIGLCTALTFASFGAKCIMTYHWGSADNDEVLEEFKKINAPTPLILNADVSKNEETDALMEEIKKHHSSIDIFISNVTVTSVILELSQYSFKDLKKSLSYSAWPFYYYVKKMKEVFGQYPRYVVGVSTTGIDQYNFGYDYVSASKVAMESLCRYMTYRLRDENINMNIIRTRAVRTWSMQKTFGDEFLDFAKHFMKEIHWMTPEEVSNVIVALCSGYLDAMRGQIINVERGTSFFDDLMHFYTKREELGLRFQDDK